MKILFTGGSTGGHFYPILAVAEEVLHIADERNLVKPELYYIAAEPYDEKALFEREIRFHRAPAGKLRNYFSLLNFFGLFLTLWGTIKATVLLFSIFPDVVFSKGSYVSVPTVIAARILGIPVVIHDSDAVPGRANLWAARFAYRIAISYPQAAEHIERKDVVALTGNPVRREIATPAKQHAHEYFHFSRDTPTILILGGSQGAQALNEVVLEALPELVEQYQVVHQTGAAHIATIRRTADVVLEQSPYKGRYKAYGYLNDLQLRMAAGAADIAISRAGSGAIFEIAAWKLPAILIPIREEVSRDQRKNAYAYARTGAAAVLEEQNLTPHLLLSEIERIVRDEERRQKMSEATETFRKPEAATKIAEELIGIALEHEEY